MAMRSLDKVTLTFGLVSIPSKIYSTNAPEQGISFHLLHAADNARLHQQYICSKDGEVVERDEMVKGYEYKKGKYVALTPEELKALDAISSNAIEIREFVPV